MTEHERQRRRLWGCDEAGHESPMVALAVAGIVGNDAVGVVVAVAVIAADTAAAAVDTVVVGIAVVVDSLVGSDTVGHE